VLATQVLAGASSLLSSLPQTDLQDAEAVAREERVRIAGALTDLQPLAERLATAHAAWTSAKAEYERSLTQDPSITLPTPRRHFELTMPGSAARWVAGRFKSAPRAQPLSDHVADVAQQVAAPPSLPEAVLVEIGADGSVAIGAGAA
jgi:alkylated DNA repair dioxygenase AlkB